MTRTDSFPSLKGLLAVAALALLPLAQGLADGPRVGTPAPDFNQVDTGGGAWSLADLKGKTVVLEWTNHQCPYVRKHYETQNMQALQKDALGKGFLWLSVISSAPGKQGHVVAAEADRLTEERGAFPKAVLLDESGQMGRAYKASTTPQMFIIGPDGVLLYMGGIDNKPTSNPADVATADNYVSAAMDGIASGRGVAQAVTRPYGCSVKY